ncbi:MAG TPA: ribonuclease HIII [archaeon]|nr:ribonuclease HIII [archaeon]
MKWVGLDESGKGDYFGYLVVAGVVIDEATAAKLKSVGVKDSKKMSDRAVAAAAKEVKRICKYDVVKISPEKYNQLYKKFKNLNKMLAWAHARVMENIVEKYEVDHIVVDKFADESVLKSMLFDKSKKKELIQKIRGEEDIAVAAASVIARDEFLKTLHALSNEVGIILPKGATHVEATAKKILEKYDENTLSLVAKTHFKTTRKVIKK